MLQDEISQILTYLDIKIEKDPKSEKDLKEWRRKVRGNSMDLATSNGLIIELQEILDRIERYNEKSPFYYTFLAYVYHTINYSDALENAKRAAHQFTVQGKEKDKNAALCNWIIGLLLYSQGNAIDAEEAFADAVQEMRKLDGLNAEDGQYINYQTIIGKMEKSRLEMKERSSNYKILKNSKHAIKHEEFSEIFGKLKIPSDGRMDDEWGETISGLEPQNLSYIDSQIKILVKIVCSPDDNVPFTPPFAYVFLTHCYNTGSHAGAFQYHENAVQYIRIAIELFNSADEYSEFINDYNRPLLQWYLALQYYNMGDFKSGIAQLEEANLFLESCLKKYQNNNENYDEFQNLKNNIQACTNRIKSTEFPSGKDQISNISPRRGPQYTHLRKNFFETESLPQLKSKGPPSRHDKGARSRSKNISPQNLINNNTHSVNVLIPVDVDTLKNLDSLSTSSKTDIFDCLRNYNGNLESVTITGKEHSSYQKRIKPESQKEIKIPSFPIYGQATAGPRGGAFLGKSLGNADAVDNTLKIVFQDTEYKVRFINDHQIKFVDGEQYGWLKVKGWSMNAATNNPIDNSDYVLFHKNYDPSSCTRKIIVALLPELDPPQLVIKRLRKLSEELPDGAGTSGYKVTKYILQSESSFDKDPLTGDNYKDIAVDRNDQVIGEVVAIAIAPK